MSPVSRWYEGAPGAVEAGAGAGAGAPVLRGAHGVGPGLVLLAVMDGPIGSTGAGHDRPAGPGPGWRRRARPDRGMAVPGERQGDPAGALLAPARLGSP